MKTCHENVSNNKMSGDPCDQNFIGFATLADQVSTNKAHSLGQAIGPLWGNCAPISIIVEL